MHDVVLRYLHRAPRGEPDPGQARLCQCQQVRPQRQHPQLAAPAGPQFDTAWPAAGAGAGSARGFAEQTLRAAFEVLNQKRPVEHLRHQVDPIPLASIRTLARSAVLPGRELGLARLETVGLQMVGEQTAEVFGSYRRGTRLFAFAGRVVRRSGRGPLAGTWVMTAFRVC